jgi:hypothetical protein
MHLRLPDTDGTQTVAKGSLWDRFKDTFDTDHAGHFVNPSPSKKPKAKAKADAAPPPAPAPKVEAPLSKLEEDLQTPAPVTVAPTTDPFEAAAGHPISRCPSADSEPPASDAGKNLKTALTKLCQSEYKNLADLWLAPGFEEKYQKIYQANGWVKEAYVNYFADFGGNRGAGFLKQTEEMIESIHRFSTRPVVAVNFGDHPHPQAWVRFPRLVVFRARPMPWGKSFNYNKFRAMMLTQAEVAIQLDSDQFVTRAADRLFNRTREEVTKDYPYPILPVHWMSKDDDPKFKGQTAYDAYAYHCAACPSRTMRWNHAHPTWTHWALPFIGNLLESYLDHGMLGQVEADKIAEDEDALNVGLWVVRATKQWCKFDIPSPDLFNPFLQQNAVELKGQTGYQDPKWYPRGIPLVFYTAHDCKDSVKTGKFLDMLNKGEPQADIYYDGKFYSNASELRAADPNLRCII